MSLSPLSIDKLLTKSKEMEAVGANQAGALAYLPPAFIQCSLPCSKPNTNYFQRINGNLTLTLSTLNPEIGLPYGSIPRLILALLGQEAVKTNCKTVEIGNLSNFLRKLDLGRTGGANGDITRIRQQLTRLFSTAISTTRKAQNRSTVSNMLIADEYDFWWSPNQKIEKNSVIILGQKFFDSLTDCKVPIDLRALQALSASPLAMDIYCWLTHRIFPLKKNKTAAIPWRCLAAQFGSNFARERDFRRSFLQSLKKVTVVYPSARVDMIENGLLLRPSPPHVARNHKS